MTIVRIGNNIHVLWKIYNNTGSKYSLSGKVRKLWLSSAALEKEIDTYQIQYRNELVFTIDAGDLTRYGTYKLVLQLSESDSQTEDATYDLTQLFQIVARTYPGACKELDGEVDVQVTSVLNNVVVERIEGLSAYEIAVNEGYVGTESEWIESLNGVGIASIDQTVIAVDDGSYNEVTFTMTNGETYTIRIRNGSKSAGVTRDDIIFALGYTPVTPAELAAKTDIFFATYNSTTWQEINEAVNAGKAVFLKKDEDIYPLVGDGGVTPKLWEFAFVDTGLNHHRAVCHNDDTWQSTTRSLATVIDLANKQDAISDLAAIRAGAALGSTAYQKPSTGIPASDIASGVIPDISGKQDTLVSGTSIKTINGSSILGSGNIEVQTEITMDNVPTSGSNNPVKSGGLYTELAEKIGSQDIDNVVELTLAQYNALATKDARTMYIISDSTIASDHVGVASLVQTTTSTEDGGTNVWTCTLTNDQSFTLEVKNGNQGNSGYSGAAGELEVVNNVTQGGATAALSAEMGKQLEGEISQLGQNLTNVIATIRLGKAQDGNIYIYVSGEPQGYGFNPRTGEIVVPIVYGDVVPSDGSLVIPSNGTATLSFKLSKAPSVNQTISLRSTSTNLTLSANSLTFTEANWDTWQNITLTNGYDDLGTENASIVITNSDFEQTETTVPVYLNGIMYEDLVDTTIPTDDMHTVTAADFTSTAAYQSNYIRLYGYNAQYTNIKIPATIDGKTVVVCSGDGSTTTFKGNTVIQYVTFENGVRIGGAGAPLSNIGESLFSGCTNLKGISNLPSAVTSLNGAFIGCSSLEFIDNLDSLTNVTSTYQTFLNCTSLEYVQDLSGITGAGLERTFRGCTSLKAVLGLPQPSSAKTFAYAFMQTAVKKATLPVNCSNLTYAFSGATQVEEVIILAEGLESSALTSIFSNTSQNINVFAPAGSTTLSTLQTMFASSTKITVSAIGGGSLPSIVVWGDSTSSPGKSWIEWPARLQTKLGTSDYLVKNEAVSGEWTTSTAARQGGDAMHTDAFTIPADTTAALVTLTTADNQVFSTAPLFSAGGSFNPCKISGVDGTISRNGASYYFTRRAAGAAVQVAADTVVTSNNDAVFNNADNIMLINIGHNAGWNGNAATLVNQMKLMVNHFLALGGTKYIVTGPWSGTWITTSSGWTTTQQVAALAAAEFGSHWLDLPGDMALNAETDNPEWEPTESDYEYMAQGKTPMSLTYDNTHPTTYGANSQMMAFYRKGVALGYWE